MNFHEEEEHMDAKYNKGDDLIVISMEGFCTEKILGQHGEFIGVRADGKLEVKWLCPGPELESRLLDPEKDVFFRPGPGWILTDRDCFQFLRPCMGHEGRYEMVQIIELPMDYAVAHGTIVLSDYSEEEREEILNLYDYDDALLEDYSVEEFNQILAECFFESEFTEYIDKLSDSAEEAVIYLSGIVKK